MVSRLNLTLAILILFVSSCALVGCGAGGNRDNIRTAVTPSRTVLDPSQTVAFTASVDGTATQGVTWETVPTNLWTPKQGAPQPDGTIVPTGEVYISVYINQVYVDMYVPAGTYKAPAATPYPGATRIMARSVENSGAEGYSTVYVAMTVGAGGLLDLDSDMLSAGSTGDIHWNVISGTTRQLEVANGARIVSLGAMGLAAFDELSRADLAGHTYVTTPIDGSDVSNSLTPGTVVGVLTTDGKYAKIQVYGYSGNSIRLIMYTFD